MSSAPEIVQVQVQVNDTLRTVTAGTGLLALLESMALSGRPGMAVAVNAEVVPRARWSDRRLHEGDQILILQASQGG
jgi:sulfur carrier protein